MCPIDIKLLYFLFLIINLLHQGVSLMCYNCSSLDNINCGKHFHGRAVNQTECDKSQGCVEKKHSVIGGGAEPTSRGCYNATMCGPNDVCIVCKRSLCNSSLNSLPSFTAILICMYSLF
ncbi:hypothetical protein ILUMI_12488 [Ignelater luminosus]|uniref:Protein sleepless n=1 Tax=Ignelater luminosus TaxID=2038154 RepID=A0A8K0G6Q6_IGNLU|nr:hypothetical protein ILUMI_12488 [Ignelater luminosus]